jgi:hypothetical protein
MKINNLFANIINMLIIIATPATNDCKKQHPANEIWRDGRISKKIMKLIEPRHAPRHCRSRGFSL